MAHRVRTISLASLGSTPVVDPGTPYDRVTILELGGGTLELQIGNSGDRIPVPSTGVLRFCPAQSNGLVAHVTAAGSGDAVLLVGTATERA